MKKKNPQQLPIDFIWRATAHTHKYFFAELGRKLHPRTNMPTTRDTRAFGPTDSILIRMYTAQNAAVGNQSMEKNGALSALFHSKDLTLVRRQPSDGSTRRCYKMTYAVAFQALLKS